MLAEKLDMTPEDAERWIVNLIRNARLDAKIDSEKVQLSISRWLEVFV
jgi:translation initiation factor 3 subunit E